jgi:hypothetical protein
MKLVNEFGNDFRETENPRKIELLLSMGFRPVEEDAKTDKGKPAASKKTDEPKKITV